MEWHAKTRSGTNTSEGQRELRRLPRRSHRDDWTGTGMWWGEMENTYMWWRTHTCDEERWRTHTCDEERWRTHTWDEERWRTHTCDEEHIHVMKRDEEHIHVMKRDEEHIHVMRRDEEHIHVMKRDEEHIHVMRGKNTHRGKPWGRICQGNGSEDDQKRDRAMRANETRKVVDRERAKMRAGRLGVGRSSAIPASLYDG